MNPSYSLTTFLFDWDGCLADTLSIWLRSWQETFSEFGIELSITDIKNKAFHNWKSPLEFGIENDESFYDSLYNRVSQRMDGVFLHDHVYETLSQLKSRHAKLGLVTSSRRSVVEIALKRYELDSLFDCILGEEDYHHSKPNPELIYKALDCLSSQKQHTIIIGDSNSDVKAGKTAGIVTAVFYPHINHQYYTTEQIDSWQPDYKIEDFRDILKLSS